MRISRASTHSMGISMMLVFATVLGGACGDGGSDDGAGGKNGGEGGSAQTNGKVTLGVRNVRTTTSLGPAISAPEGKVFLVLDVTLTNESVDDGVLDSPTYFSLTLISKVSIAASPFAVSVDNACVAKVTANVGGSTTCSLAFEIAENDQATTLVYEVPAGPRAMADVPTPSSAFDGDWLLTLSTNLSPSKPFLGRVTIAKAPSDQSYAVSGAWLDATDQKTPVGANGALGTGTLDNDGSFDVTFPTFMIPGAANAITGGDVSGMASFDAQPTSEVGFVCGAVSGQLTQPSMTDLAGSTFTLQRIDGALPTPRLSCTD